MRKILTISELTRDIKEVLENIFDGCCVEGEISNFRQPTSGHLYFSLKDAAAALRCVCFRMSAARLKFRLQDGMQVIAIGRVGVYEKEGQYQLYVDSLEPKGQGALQLAFEQLKQRLAREGLFDEARKKPLPLLPRAIGVVTSPTGAVIRDIIEVLGRRFPCAHIIINPVRVQGEGAADEIAAAIVEFNELDNVDVMIVARGGGSLEDLWCFNEEVVARAIAASVIPVISAVGHETDFTIADFVADTRAPTPSAAAEIVLPSRAQLDEKIDNLLKHLSRGLVDVVPQYSQRLDDLFEQLSRGTIQLVRTYQLRLAGIKDELKALDPLAVLKRGYSLTSIAATGHLITRSTDVKKGDFLRTKLADGVVTSVVEEDHGV